MRTVNFILPDSWIKLSSTQLIFVARLFLSEFAKQKFRFLTHAFIKFSGCKIKKTFKYNLLIHTYLLKMKGEKPFILSVNQLHSVVSKLDFLLDEITELKPLKKIRFARSCHYRLYKTPFIQFLTAENFYTAYRSTDKLSHLNELVATLYQKPSDVFNDSLVKKRARYFRWVSIYKKYTVFLWYSGFRYYLAQEYPYIFSNSSSGEELKIKDHIMNMIRGLTEGDVTKNDKIFFTDTHQALYELNAKAKHIEEMNQKLKK